MPDGDNFKVSFYNQETGSIESVPLDDNKTFLLAVHKNGEGATVRSVYKDLPSVAACAFNLEEGSDPNLLKGLIKGWNEVTLPKLLMYKRQLIPCLIRTDLRSRLRNILVT